MANSDSEIPISLSIDTSALSDLENLASNVPTEIDIDVSADTSDLSELDDLSYEASIETTLTGDGLPFDEIPEETNTDVNVTETEDAKTAIADIHFLALKEKIETVWNIIGTGIDFITSVGNTFVSPFLDVEDAVAKINAQTGSGTGIDDLGQFIRDIQAADLGDSVEQISDVVIHAQQLGAPIKEATTASLTFVKVFDDQNPATVMDTLKGAADEFNISITNAGDALTVFFQNGGNKGGDAIEAVDKYSTSWKDMNLTFTEGLSLLHSLQEGGVDSANAAGQMIQNFDDAFTTAAANPTSAQAEFLKSIGLENPKDAGQALGAETVDGFVAAFINLPADKQDLASQLFFGKGGKLNTSAIANATTQDSIFAEYIGAAEDAATAIDDSLRGAIDDFVLEVNTTITELLSSDKIDLPGKIKALKEGFQEAVDVLANGGTVGEALEVALNIPGLADTLNTFIGNFQRIIGNVEIVFLQLVATIQDITGHGQEAAATREVIRTRAAGQLAFDLQLGNPEEIATQVNQAMSRGLSSGEAGTVINQALNETISKGDFSQGGNIIQGLIEGAIKNGASPEAANQLAADYITKLQGVFDNALSAGNLDLLQNLIAIEPNAKIPGLDEAVAGFQKQLSDAFTPKGTIDSTNPFLSGIGAGTEKQGATGKGGLFGGLIEAADSTVDKLSETSTSLSGFDTLSKTSTDNVASNFSDLQISMDGSVGEIITAMDNAAAKSEEMDTRMATALTENTVTSSFDTVAESAGVNFPIVLQWFDTTAQGAAELDAKVTGSIGHMSKMLHDLQFLSAQVAQGVKDALQAGANLPGLGAGGGGNTTNNTTVNQTNNNQNNAQTTATTYQIAEALS